MSRNWQQDKEWSGTYVDELKRICAQYLIGEAPKEEDCERNTDLIVLKLDPVRVACRVRKFSYCEKYGHQFTIRTARPSGVKTELRKVIEGWGDYIIYAFADQYESGLFAWMLGDLKVFRAWHSEQLYKFGGRMPGIAKKNLDGSSDFMAFDIASLPADFVVARVAPYSIKAA